MRLLVLALIGVFSSLLAIAAYLSICWVAGWAAYTLGYETRLGYFMGMVGGVLAPMNFGAVAILLLAALFFFLFRRKWARKTPSM
jgi:uncharacterized membrane protein